jgi:hypothetical protein
MLITFRIRKGLTPETVVLFNFSLNKIFAKGPFLAKLMKNRLFELTCKKYINRNLTEDYEKRTGYH